MKLLPCPRKWLAASKLDDLVTMTKASLARLVGHLLSALYTGHAQACTFQSGHPAAPNLLSSALPISLPGLQTKETRSPEERCLQQSPWLLFP